MTHDRKAHQTGAEGAWRNQPDAAPLPDTEPLSERAAGWLLLQQSVGNRALGSMLRRASRGARLAMVEKRARDLLERHHAAARDALRAFVAASGARLVTSQETIIDAVGMTSALAGVAADFILAALPRVGLQVGRALTLGVQAASDGFARQNAGSADGARHILRRFEAACEQGLVSGFKQVALGLAPTLSSITDPDTREALETGSQELIDAVIDVELGLHDPGGAGAYGEMRRALEEELVLWLQREQPLERVEPKAALAAPDSDDNNIGRQSEKRSPARDQTGKAH